jgi:ATP-dependent RNA helicase DeaD
MKSTDTVKNSEATPTASFDQFTFSSEIKKAILEMGYTAPTPIQEQTLPILLGEATDFLGLAATGTGKTAAFGIPLLEKLDSTEKGVQALILCPTRELAKQVSEQMNLLARYKKIKTLAIYGGSDYSGQLRALKEGVSIVVGTPGRIIDHLERGTLILDSLTTIVLDEADEMISMGFKEDIEAILERAADAEQLNTWLFSATMGREIRKIADHFLNEPKQIQVNKTEMVTTSVTQYFYQVREEEKPEVIGKLIDQVPGFYGLIFCQTKALVTELTQTLKSNGYLADCLHGDMEQNARERAMKAFKAKSLNILVCTDVASRGIDVKDLTHVINYSLPRELDLYVHRIGRTGRGGKVGLALSLVTPSHMNLVRKIEAMTKSKMTRANLPTDAELLNIKVGKLLADFNADPAADSLGSTEIEKIITTSGWNDVMEAMTKEEIIARFLSHQLKAPKEKKPDALHPESGFRDDKRRSYMGRTGGGRSSDGYRGGGYSSGGYGGGYSGGNRSEGRTYEPRPYTPPAPRAAGADGAFKAPPSDGRSFERLGRPARPDFGHRAARAAASETSFTPSRPFTPSAERADKKPFDKAPTGKASYEKKPYEKKAFSKAPSDKAPFEKKTYAKAPFEKKPFEKKAFEKKPFEKKAFGDKPFKKKAFGAKPAR